MATVLANKPAENFGLHNYPNPFYQTTTIEYRLPQNGKVRLSLYDLSGNKIATLIDEKQTAGTHAINVKAGKLLPGTYYYRIESGEFSETKRLIILK